MATTMRDAFLNSLYKIAREDKDVVLVISDMGAPALDRFKLDLPSQIVNVGIAEQNAILIAAGLAITGKKPYVYSISSFITTRCYEQIRLFAAGMHLPITIVGVGAGVCYEESGPTHHSVEDIAILRGLPTMKIFNVSDNKMAEMVAEWSYQYRGPSYVRLDRVVQPDIDQEIPDYNVGLRVHRPLHDVNIITTGNMITSGFTICNELLNLGINVGLIENYTFPINPESLIKTIQNSKLLITLEEHSLAGGLGSNVCEVVMDTGLSIKVKRFGFDVSEGYCYKYGGRAVIHKEYCMDEENVVKAIKTMIK